MSEPSIPTTDEIRYRVEHGWEPYGNGSFDRWLAQHDAEVQAKALREAAEGLRAGVRGSKCNPGCHEADQITLRLRSDHIEKEADLRAGIEALDILGPDESRDPDAAPMSGEEVRWRPAPASSDSADVREQVAVEVPEQIARYVEATAEALNPSGYKAGIASAGRLIRRWRPEYTAARPTGQGGDRG